MFNIQRMIAERKLGLRRKFRRHRATMSRSLKWISENFNIETVIDVGASNGCWSWLCMAYFPKASYVLYEPMPLHSEALDRFVAFCDTRVLTVKKAVAGEPGKGKFDAGTEFGGALQQQANENTIEVDITTIDLSLPLLDAKGPYLLKLDTHGVEKQILDGATGTLLGCEILIIEAYNFTLQEGTLRFWELCDYLHKREFLPIDLVDVGHRKHDNCLWQMDLVFAKASWKGFSHVAYQ